MNRITASSIERLIKCPAHVRKNWASGVSSKHADKGTAIHQAIDEYAKYGTINPELDKENMQMVRSALNTLGEYDSFKTEQAYCIDFEYGRVRQLDVTDRQYPAAIKEFEIPGTLDAVCVKNGKITVIDWKTGNGDMQSIEDNAQLMFAAYAAMGESEGVTAEIHHLNSGVVESAVIPRGKLGEFETTVYEAQLSTDTAERPGAHCQYCPAKADCKAMSRGIMSAVAGTITSKDAADAAMQIFMVDKALKEAKSRLNSYVMNNGPIQLPDGSFYAMTEKNRDSIDGEAIFNALAQRGHDAPLSLAKISYTKKSIVDSLGKKEAVKFLKEMKDAGAIVSKPQFSFGVVRNKANEHRGDAGDCDVLGGDIGVDD